MIERNTVLVLGAGASCSYGLPLGSKLRDLILNLPDQDLDTLPTDMSVSLVTRGQSQRFKEQFRQSRWESIDAFLSHRPEWEALGKHAIASALLPQENRKILLEDGGSDDWYQLLLRAMDAPWEEYGRNKIAFITFNYDRSLELLLFTALQQRYGKTAAEVRQVMNGIEILHVYGSLGSIHESDANFVPYGGGSDPQRHLYRAASGILVMGQGREDSPAFIRARELLAQADALCFLGFAFDPLNVRRLGGQGISAAGRIDGDKLARAVPFAGSALGLSTAETRRAAGSISETSFVRAAESGLMGLNCSSTLRESLILG